MATAARAGSFPSPFEIETPPGCEGWEEMYPYYALFAEERREPDEDAALVLELDALPGADAGLRRRVASTRPYYAARRLAEPGLRRAARDGHRLPRRQRLHLHLGNPVTDPAKIAERAEFFQKRAGYYFQNWDELYGEVADEDGGADRRARPSSRSRRCPSTSPTRSSSATTATPRFYKVLDAYSRALRLGELMWQHHFEFLLLGYGAYLTFVGVLQGRRCPTSPTSTSPRWSPASTCSCSGPTRSCAGWRGWRSRPASTARSREGRSPAEIDAELAQSDAGRRVARGAREGQGPVVQHGHGRRPVPLLPQLVDDPSIPYASLIGHISALRDGRARRAPDRGARARARPARRGVRGAAARRAARGVRRAARPVADGVPVRRGAQVLLRLLVPHPLVEQDPRVRRAARRARLPRGRRGRLPALAPRGRCRRSRSSCLHWATGGAAARADALAADRRAAQGAAGQARRLDAAAGARRDARGGHRPDDDHALGRDHRAPAGVGARTGRGGTTLRGCGRRRRAWSRARRASCAASTRSATSATARSSCADHLAGVGADLLQDQGDGHRHRRRDVARGDRLPRVRAARGRRHRPRDAADPHRPDDPRRRLRRARSRSSTASGGVVTDGAHAAPGRAAPAATTPRVRRQEREPRRAARRRDPGAAGVRAVDRRRSTRSSRRRPRGPHRAALAASPATSDACGGRGAIARRCRRRPCPRRCAPRSEDAASAEAGGGEPAGGGALERGRRGQRGGDVRRPAGDLPLGARRRRRVRRRPRLLGEPVQPAGDQLPGAARRTTPRRRWASTVQLMVDAEVSGVMFTCNPVSGDPSIGRGQRELGPRPGRRRR